MTFKKTNLDVDLGETNLENLFIDSYMQSANEIQLKVYILGLYFSEKNYSYHDIYSISEKLMITPVEVVEAFKYWEDRGLVKIEHSTFDELNRQFSVSYVGAKNLYLASILNIDDESFVKSMPKTKPKPIPRDEKILNIIRDEEIVRFFDELEIMISQPISPNDRLKIAKLISSQNMTHEMIREAYYITYIKKGITDSGAVNYVESIIRNWASESIYTKKDLIDSSNIKRELIKSLGISSNHIKTEALSSFLAMWRGRVESDSLLLNIANYSARKSNSPSISRLENLLNDISRNYPLTVDGFNSYINNAKIYKPKQQAKPAHMFNKEFQTPNQDETEFLLERAKIMARRKNEQ